jgi:biotin transport system substrate-specific component
MTSAPDNAVPARTDIRPSDAVAALAAPVSRSSVATDVALIATFAAFIAVCAILPSIPTGSGVPITLQTFGVILSGLVLGWRRGGLAALLYLALGLVGLPIFAEGTGGVAVLSKASAGYLLAFPVAAALAGAFAGLGLRGVDRFLGSDTATALTARFDRLGAGLAPAWKHPARLLGASGAVVLRALPAWRYLALVLSGLAASFLTIHTAGIAGLMLRLDVSFREALAFDLPFWPGDLLKNLVAGAVAMAIFRAFPDMLRNRR